MSQISTKPMPTKPLIDATVPGLNPSSPVKNISAAERKKMEEGWNQKAAERAQAIERETVIPAVPSRTIRCELRRYGRMWQAFYQDGKKMVAVLPAPSLLDTVMGALQDHICEQAMKP